MDPTTPQPKSLALAAILGAAAGALCHWVLPPASFPILISLLCVAVGLVNLKPPYLIPNELTLFGLTAGLVRPVDQLPWALAGLLACWVWFWLLERIGQIGRGCTKWAAVLGLLLNWPLGLLNCLLAFLLGTLLAIPLLLLQRDARTPLPFGIFLSVAGVATTWGGPAFLRWLDI